MKPVSNERPLVEAVDLVKDFRDEGRLFGRGRLLRALDGVSLKIDRAVRVSPSRRYLCPRVLSSIGRG